MRSRTLTLLVGVTCGALGWTAGHVDSANAHADPIYERLGVFSEVLAHVQNRYYRDVDDGELVEAAIDGMLGELDPHSVYMDPEAYQAMRDDTRGQYVGIGISIRGVDSGVEVREVFDGGPAARVGLIAGDVIVEIDGVSSVGLESSEVVSLLRGRRGDSVHIVVERVDSDPDAPERIAVDVVRDIVALDAVVSSSPEPGIGLVQLRQFQADAGDEVRAAIDRLQSDYGAPLDGVILDLRGNPGGLLSEAVNVSDAFLSEGRIVSTGGRAQASQAYEARRSTTRYDGPLVVLMDAGSASASEIVAGALQDNGRAPIIGTQSYGKGSVQTVIDLSDGSGLKLTISLYYTPSGRSIQGEGITPDIEVARPSADDDTQLSEAIRQLRAAGEPSVAEAAE